MSQDSEKPSEPDEMFRLDPSRPELSAPLACFEGEAPEAPRWFRKAIDAPHERSLLARDGFDVEWLGWGERGKPGLLFLHGNSAHADWWRFIAPYFADRFRVAAPSLPGMGGSSHRPHYRTSDIMDDIMAVADAAGLGDRFTVVGHSYGGLMTAGLAARFPGRVATAIIVDAPFGSAAEFEYDEDELRKIRKARFYPTVAAALARFHYVPPQPCPNPWITDFIARTSLKEEAEGVRWKYDQNFLARLDTDVPLGIPPARPDQRLGFIWGQYSAMIRGHADEIAGLFPAGTPCLMIPEAFHHIMIDQPIALVAGLSAMLS